MKHITYILLIASTFFAADIRGQGFVYLSNSNQTVNSSYWTIGEIWIPIMTGANASGYLLNSLTVLFASNDNPVATTAAVFDYSSSSYTDFYTGIEVGTAGYYTFTPNTPISLATDSHYLILISQSDVLSSVTANWNFISSSAVTSVDNWGTSLTDGADIPLFAISATPVAPVPEPAAVSLVCLGAFVFIVFQRNRRPPPPNKLAM